MNEQIKKMAELLRSGATMLQETCPSCSSPLFKFEGKVSCVKCGWQPSRATEPEKSVNLETMVSQMRSTIVNKLEKLNDEVNKNTDFNNLYKLAKVILTLLRDLEHLERLSAK